MSRRFGGSGLGLAIVHDLVHLMNGEIAVESTLGKVYTFTIAIPLANGSSQSRRLPEWMPQLRGRRVVVSCNNEARGQHWLSLLRWGGHRGHSAHGQRARPGRFPRRYHPGRGQHRFPQHSRQSCATPGQRTPALIVHGVSSPEGKALPMPEWIEGELPDEPFGDVALWTELAQMWGLAEEEEGEGRGKRQPGFRCPRADGRGQRDQSPDC